MIIFTLLLIVFGAVILFGIFKGYGDNRSIVVFRDYNDLGLTFLVPSLFLLTTYLLSTYQVDINVTFFISALVSLWPLIKLVQNTYADNGHNLFKTTLALVTKIPLGVFWILNLVQIFNPKGTGKEKNLSRGKAFIILAVLTPIIHMLVVDKSGSFFNPKTWVKSNKEAELQK